MSWPGTAPPRYMAFCRHPGRPSRRLIDGRGHTSDATARHPRHLMRMSRVMQMLASATTRCTQLSKECSLKWGGRSSAGAGTSRGLCSSSQPGSPRDLGRRNKRAVDPDESALATRAWSKKPEGPGRANWWSQRSGRSPASPVLRENLRRARGSIRPRPRREVAPRIDGAAVPPFSVIPAGAGVPLAKALSSHCTSWVAFGYRYGEWTRRHWGVGLCRVHLSTVRSGPTSSSTATGASHSGQQPPMPTRRANVPHSQRCSPSALLPQASHS